MAVVSKVSKAALALAFVFMASVGSLASSLAHAGVAARDLAPAPPVGCCGDSPIPFATLNKRVELADGEFYELYGTVSIIDGQAFFSIDYTKLPTLQNDKRKLNPYYPLYGETQSGFWNSYDGVSVKIYVQANAQVLKIASGIYDYVISLKSLSDPTTTYNSCSPPENK